MIPSLRISATGFLALVAAFGVASAQSTPSDPPVPDFEVATIRPWTPPPPPPPPPPGEEIITERVITIGPSPSTAQPQDRVHLIGTIKQLIAITYELRIGQESRILDLPSWADEGSQRYEINAKIDDATLAALNKLPSRDQRHQINLMEQKLLAERFHLTIHTDTRDLPVFELVLAKDGPKLTPSKPEEKTTITSMDRQGGTELTAVSATLNDFSHAPMFLSTPAISNHDIINHTGLTDRYDFKLRYATERPGTESEPSDVPGLFTAIQEQLGLKLVATKAATKVFVVDHVEKPGEN